MKQARPSNTPLMLIAFAAALAAIVAAVASSAAASSNPVSPIATAHLTAGTPSIAQPTSTITFTKTLTGATTDYFNDVASGDKLEVVDPGNATGWDVTASATAFSCDNVTTPGCGTDTFTGMSLTKSTATLWTDSSTPTISCTNGAGTCVSPTNTPNTAGWGSPLSSTVTLYTADADSGLGSISFDTAWWIAVPNDIREGDYKSTVTLDIAPNGP